MFPPVLTSAYSTGAQTPRARLLELSEWLRQARTVAHLSQEISELPLFDVLVGLQAGQRITDWDTKPGMRDPVRVTRLFNLDRAMPGQDRRAPIPTGR
jgi:hypothetical protein